MPYQLGKYKAHNGIVYDLNNVEHEIGRHFVWLMKEYIEAESWKDFQNRTAAVTVQTCMKLQQKWVNKGYPAIKWEQNVLYQIRSDMLRNVGIRHGELPGELSDMIISAEKN